MFYSIATAFSVLLWLLNVFDWFPLSVFLVLEVAQLTFWHLLLAVRGSFSGGRDTVSCGQHKILYLLKPRGRQSGVFTHKFLTHIRMTFNPVHERRLSKMPITPAHKRKLDVIDSLSPLR
jgi:hypothetical protein